MMAATNRAPDVLAEALAYARRGWRVIPLTWPGLQAHWCRAPGKQPVLKEWQKESTVDEGRIRWWFKRWPQAGVGIKTGKESGLVVLDIDPKNGGEDSLRDLTGSYGPLPDTPQVLTGGGGRHLYFRYPEGRTVPDRISLAPGIDIRADGGQVVAPPSLHISGRRYEWEVSSHPDDVELAEMPPWLLALIDRPKQGASVKVPDVIPSGSRNDVLFRVGASLRDKGLSHEGILAALKAENAARCVPPLPDNEVEVIAKQAARYEPKHDYTATKAKAVNGVFTPGEWPEPEEIKPEQLLPVEPLSADIIPQGLGAWCSDVAYRMQCPLDFTAVGAVVAAGAVIGASCAIRPKRNDDWEVIPNLWGGIVARPSMMKTPSLAEVMKPLARLEAEGKEAYDAAMRLHGARQEAYKAQREAIRQEMVKAAKANISTSSLEMELASLEPDPEPGRQRYRTSDATIEKLGELLSENPRGILVFRDELTGLLASWDREDRQSDRAFFLEGWNGNQPFTTDRIGRGTVDVANVCISILGGIQPAKLTAYLLQAAGNLTNDGMIQRFQLLIYPDEPKDWALVDDKPNKEAKQRAFGVFIELAKADPLTMGAVRDEEGGRPYFRFDDEGQAVFFAWLTELEGKIRSEDRPLVCEHLAKYRSLMPSLALVFHMIDVASGAEPGPVSGAAARMAAEWCDYLELHARRIYGLLSDVRQKSAAALADKIRRGVVKNGFTAREVYRKEWYLLDTPELVKDACQELIEAGWIREEVITTPGRQKSLFAVNPKISRL